MKNRISHFYKEERPRMVAFVRKLFSDVSDRDGEDIVQDVMLSIWNSTDASPVENLSSYVYRALRNRVIDAFRKTKDDVSMNEETGYDSTVTMSEFLCDLKYSVEDESERKEISRLIFEALDLLRSDEREIVCLTEFEGMSFKDCSKILGEPVGTLLSRKSRALKKMENILHQIGFTKEDYYDE